MIGLFGVGTALLLGIGVRVAAISGVAMLLLMYTAAAIQPEHNPFLDDHIIYALILAGLPFVGAGRHLGFGGWWERTQLVRLVPVLK